MNLLTEKWIPVRPQLTGSLRQIDLQTLICGDECWELALPRDDMELAALQLLICLAQVLLPPADKKEWVERVTSPVSVGKFRAAIQPYQDWFQLDHSEYPFMQVKGVPAKEPTSMDKLLAGLDSSTNSRFINEPNLASGLCFGCVAIALYNLANNAPSFGGGFKFGLRGSCPVSTFSRGQDLRSTIWINVLSEESLDEYVSGWRDNCGQPPTWVESIKEKSTISAHGIGLLRGLFWQPGHTQLIPPKKSGQCSCCGQNADKLFAGFNKSKFTYTIDGLWEHPHSPQVSSLKSGAMETRYLGFTQSIPAWTQLSRYVVRRDLSEVGKGEKGQRPALVIEQLERYLSGNGSKFELLVGGYRNNQAAILERRHELLTLNHGWEKHTATLHELVSHGLKYKTALRKVLYVCSQGIKEKERKLKGTGLDLQVAGEIQFYRRSEGLMTDALANIDFNKPTPTFVSLDEGMGNICVAIFEELTSPYAHDPELFRTLAIARRSLQKHIKEIRIPEAEEDAA